MKTPFIDLSDSSQATVHTHTAAGTAELVSGFGVNAFIAVWGDNACWFGPSKAEAERHAVGLPANQLGVFRIFSSAVWVDTATSGKVYIAQMRL